MPEAPIQLKAENVLPLLFEVRPASFLPGEVGLFACAHLERGTVVLKDSEEIERLLPWSEFDKLDDGTKRKVAAFCVTTDEGIQIPEFWPNLPIEWFMNHSCEPNIGFNQEDHLVAIRYIQAGEELTWDYATCDFSPRFFVECRCGSPRCRGLVTGNDWQNPEYARSVFNIMPAAQKVRVLREVFRRQGRP